VNEVNWCGKFFLRVSDGKFFFLPKRGYEGMIVQFFTYLI